VRRYLKKASTKARWQGSKAQATKQRKSINNKVQKC
jgi:hypothetical protein